MVVPMSLSQSHRLRRKTPMEEEKPTSSSKTHKPPPPPTPPQLPKLKPLQTEELQLAALAISFNIRLRCADMPFVMQERAIRHTRAFLDAAAAAPSPTIIARSLKKEFDTVYGPAWHCIAGKSFGSFVTHSPGGFVYFSADSLFILLFKTQVQVIPRSH